MKEKSGVRINELRRIVTPPAVCVSKGNANKRKNFVIEYMGQICEGTLL